MTFLAIVGAVTIGVLALFGLAIVVSRLLE